MNPTNDRTLALTALACMDLTALGDESDATITQLCSDACTPFGNVAAVCTWPEFVPLAKRLLDGAVPIATVINFPGAQDQPDKVRTDCTAAVASGADEIDVVAPWHALLAGDEARYIAVLDAARDGSGTAALKVIIESGELTESAPISRATQLSIEHGADFVKTSTGKTSVSATPAAAETMLAVIAGAGRNVGFKASGGVRSVADAAVYIGQVRALLGEDAAMPARFRIGASSLLGDVLKTLG